MMLFCAVLLCLQLLTRPWLHGYLAICCQAHTPTACVLLAMQDVPSKMVYYDQTVKMAGSGETGGKYWQAQQHLRPLLLHPAWEEFALLTLIGQTKVQIWRIKLKHAVRQLDDDPPELQALEEQLACYQGQLASASSASGVILTKKQAARELKKLRVLGCNPSLTTVQQVWDQFWLVERKLSKGWSYQNKRSMSGQSKLRRGLVGWVLLKLRLQLPSAHSNKPGPYAHLWGTWSDSAMQDQLSCLDARLQATAASNRRNGQLGTLKHTLQDEFGALLKKAERKAARRAACAHAAKAI